MRVVAVRGPEVEERTDRGTTPDIAVVIKHLIVCVSRGKPAPRLACSQRLNNNVNNNLEKSGRLVAYFLFLFLLLRSRL